MDIRTIVQIMRVNGGATVNPLTLHTPTFGYAVSVYGAERIVSGADLVSDVEAYLYDTFHDWTAAGRFFGAWFNAENGAWYLDASVVIPDRAAALEFARQNRQIAIYDLELNETIYV